MLINVKRSVRKRIDTILTEIDRSIFEKSDGVKRELLDTEKENFDLVSSKRFKSVRFVQTKTTTKDEDVIKLLL